MFPIEGVEAHLAEVSPQHHLMLVFQPQVMDVAEFLKLADGVDRVDMHIIAPVYQPHVDTTLEVTSFTRQLFVELALFLYLVVVTAVK